MMTRKLIQFVFLGLFFLLVLNGKMVLWLGLFLVSLIGAKFFGRFYCGYICPMGTAMGYTDLLAKKLKWQTKKIPKWLESKALPWILLIIMIVSMALSKRVIQKDMPILILLMILSVLVTLRFEERVFHNSLCPFGALLSFSGKWASFATTVDQSQCIGCKKCENVCPSTAIKVDTLTKRAQINPAICHQCGACVEVCPKDTIHYQKRG